MKLQRPAVRYHGGKWRLAPWIIAHFPPHRIYVEPFGGGASCLLRKPRSHSEVYNDLDKEIVNLFQQLRDRGAELVRLVELTPFSRSEFELSYLPSDDNLEQARRTLVRSFQGFGAAAISGEISGFRCNSHNSHTTPGDQWRNYPGHVPALIERLRGVVIEQRDALHVMRQHDAPDALHYCDPPYVHSTRSDKTRGTATKRTYKHEMTDGQHRHLAGGLKALKGAVVLSGYRCPLYDELYADWVRIDKVAMADGARQRIESLWLSRPPVQDSIFKDAA